MGREKITRILILSECVRLVATLVIKPTAIFGASFYLHKLPPSLKTWLKKVFYVLDRL